MTNGEGLADLPPSPGIALSLSNAYALHSEPSLTTTVSVANGLNLNLHSGESSCGSAVSLSCNTPHGAVELIGSDDFVNPANQQQSGSDDSHEKHPQCFVAANSALLPAVEGRLTPGTSPVDTTTDAPFEARNSGASRGSLIKSRGTALITGAGRRLGRALALRLAEKGFDIAVHHNQSTAEADECAAKVQSLGRRSCVFQANLLRRDEVEDLIEQVYNWMPSLSLLVNNASIWKPSSFIESSADGVLESVGIHLVAPYLLTRDFARHVEHGQVINIIDTAISKNKTDFFPYLLSKKGLHDLTMMCALELAPRIRVNALAPGIVLPAEGPAGDVYSKTFDTNPLQHAASPLDVIAAMEYLIDSPHVTGQCMFISGGEQLE